MRSIAFAMVPLRVRAAAVLLGLFGIGLIVYTVILTVPLLADPDPMAGLELIVSRSLSSAHWVPLAQVLD